MFEKFALLFFALIIAITSLNAQKCGVPSKSVSLIVKGNEYTRGTWPWTVALMLRRNNQQKFFCAGVLIAKTKVLTAGHCIQDKEREVLLARDILLLFGVHDLNDRNQNGVYSASAAEVTMHPDWNPYGEKYDADIALITVDDEIPYTRFIQPICIASDEIEATEGFVTGWGKSEDESKLHENIPKVLKVPIWTNEHCYLEAEEFTKLASRRTLCAGSRDGTGVCNGDSGGGLFVKNGDAFFLKGIISASLVKQGKCDVSNFALYTNVNKFIRWINVDTQEVSSKFSSSTCGVMSKSAGLIQKGTKSTAVQWPWVVVLFNKAYQAVIDGDTYSDFQIGTLISDKHVIGDGTYFSKDVDGKRVPIATDLLKSYFGVINIDEFASSHSLVLDGAEKIVLHPDYGKIDSLKFANLVVIKMKSSIPFSEFISPVCISSFSNDPYSLSGRFAYAVGQGYSETGKTKDRQHTAIRIRAKEICDVEFNYNLGTAKEKRSNYFCAGGDGRSNGCWSDHPLYLKLDGKWFLHGFHQVSYNDGKGCSTTFPTLFELAGIYSDWIKQQIS